MLAQFLQARFGYIRARLHAKLPEGGFDELAAETATLLTKKLEAYPLGLGEGTQIIDMLAEAFNTNG